MNRHNVRLLEVGFEEYRKYRDALIRRHGKTQSSAFERYAVIEEPLSYVSWNRMVQSWKSEHYSRRLSFLLDGGEYKRLHCSLATEEIMRELHEHEPYEVCVSFNAPIRWQRNANTLNELYFRDIGGRIILVIASIPREHFDFFRIDGGVWQEVKMYKAVSIMRQ